jgi:WXXGXW repeat (2 copies)
MRPKVTTALQCGLVGIVLAVSLGGCVAYAGRPAGPAYYGVEVEVAPPPLRVVEVPPPRPGYVWAPGYWRWNGREHVWADGRWLPERRGWHWVPEHWDEHNGRWRFAQGHWER